MKIALVAPTAIPIPVEGYSGIEREVEYLATALHRKGHEVHLYCKKGKGDGKRYPWYGNIHDIPSENEVFAYMDELKEYDVVHDWSHLKPLRMAGLKNYLATVMWSDKPAFRNVFPSRAVAESFGKPDGAVIPLGLPVEGYGDVVPGDGYYICAGRMAHYKGTDIAVDVAWRRKVRLTVAGHTGAFADGYFSMSIKKKCATHGFRYIPNPDDAEMMRLIAHASGMIHMHRWLESFSLTVAQALCMGIPVLTSNVGAPQELVQMVEGGTVSPIPENGTTQQIEEYFSKQYTLDERRGIAERARRFFDINRVAELYINVYGGT